MRLMAKVKKQDPGQQLDGAQSTETTPKTPKFSEKSRKDRANVSSSSSSSADVKRNSKQPRGNKAENKPTLMGGELELNITSAENPGTALTELLHTQNSCAAPASSANPIKSLESSQAKIVKRQRVKCD